MAAPLVGALLAGALLLACSAAPRPIPTVPFRLTYYYVAEERGGEPRHWPLYAPACRAVIARTGRTFHREVSREGTGLLRDGRLVNFAERCDCAAPGHQGSRICYVELDRAAYPWGQGAGGPAPPALQPFRSVAVDPSVIPIGTVLFIPAFRGRLAPDGSRLDGCFRADDRGRLVRGAHVDLFTGRARWARHLARDPALREVRVFAGGVECAGRIP